MDEEESLSEMSADNEDSPENLPKLPTKLINSENVSKVSPDSLLSSPGKLVINEENRESSIIDENRNSPIGKSCNDDAGIASND